jgi:drug/metabolite transporter (DMT)-like permease
MTRAVSVTTYLKLTLTAVFWGGTFIAARVVARGIGPFSATFLRFAIAAAVLLVLLARSERGFPRLRLRQVPAVTLLGLTGIFAYNVCFFMGLKRIEAGRAALIVAMCPVLLALFAALFLRERLTLVRSVGIALSVTGAIVVISRGQPGALFRGGVGLGELCILGCVVCWTAYTLVGQRLMSDLSPLASVTYSVLAGVVLLVPFACLEGLVTRLGTHRLEEWLGLAYLGIFGTVVGFVWYYEGVQRVGSVRAGLFINLVPVCAVLIAAWLLGEPLTLSLLVGGILVVAGVTLNNLVGLSAARAARRPA